MAGGRWPEYAKRKEDLWLPDKWRRLTLKQMIRNYEIHCTLASGETEKMATIAASNSADAKRVGINLALTLGIHFSHTTPEDERSESPKNFNKPETKNKQ